jgi:hypothetical protein
LTVYAVDEFTGKPLQDVPVTIRYNFPDPGRPRKRQLRTIKTGADGKAIFDNLTLDTSGFSISVFSRDFRSSGLDPVFLPPATQTPPTCSYQVFHVLPAEICIKVRRRRFTESLQLLYPGL